MMCPKTHCPQAARLCHRQANTFFSALYKRRINSGAVIILAVFYLIRRCGSICIACRCGCVIINACCRTSYQRQQHKCARNIALTAVFIILFSFLGGQCLVWHRAACQCLFNGVNFIKMIYSLMCFQSFVLKTMIFLHSGWLLLCIDSPFQRLRFWLMCNNCCLNKGL